MFYNSISNPVTYTIHARRRWCRKIWWWSLLVLMTIIFIYQTFIFRNQFLRNKLVGEAPNWSFSETSFSNQFIQISWSEINRTQTWPKTKNCLCNSNQLLGVQKQFPNTHFIYRKSFMSLHYGYQIRIWIVNRKPHFLNRESNRIVNRRIHNQI